MSKSSPIHSMTGFGSVEGPLARSSSGAESRVRVEIKALNHRFLDLKLRLPRELSSAELPLRSAIQASFSRGAVEVKVERIAEGETPASPPVANLALAAHYFESLVKLQRTLGLTDPIRTSDIAAFPDVLTRPSQELQAEEAWLSLEPLVRGAIKKVMEMRAHEGAQTVKAIRTTLDEMESRLGRLRARREECKALYQSKLREKIREVFEAYPLSDLSAKGVLESRISQELALVLDRTDIEEELTRFKGHLEHFRKVLDAGGQVGRKLDFLLQEINREANTLGTKGLDIQISEDIVQLKVQVEQTREQVMNLE